MNTSSLDLTKIHMKEFNPKIAPKDLWKKYHLLNEKLLLEVYQKDKLPNREVIEKSFNLEFLDFYITYWLIFKNKKEKNLIGICYYSYLKDNSALYKNNKEIGFIDIKLDSDYRRQGVGTKLLRILATILKEKNCKYIETETIYPSGFNFCEKYNGKLTNIKTQSRLYLDNVDWQMIESWIKVGSKSNPEVNLECFYSAPDENLEEYCNLLSELDNEAPTLEKEEDEKFTETYTPERYREFEHHLKERTYTMYSIRTVEADGNISGLTEIFYSEKNTPEEIKTGLTGVKSEYRGKGLGKWMKASMLKYIKENIPQAKYIVTGNADHNAPMLSINTRLGFKPYLQRKSYRFTIDDLLSFIESNDNS